mmetsp:Transcript_38272/g.38621  ORF Transcript_38272/g.38621 Transcript_38272/m.38621 type:complete len:80 (-) Transcript_38272:217-456(-)
MMWPRHDSKVICDTFLVITVQSLIAHFVPVLYSRIEGKNPTIVDHTIVGECQQIEMSPVSRYSYLSTVACRRRTVPVVV